MRDQNVTNDSPVHLPAPNLRSWPRNRNSCPGTKCLENVSGSATIFKRRWWIPPSKLRAGTQFNRGLEKWYSVANGWFLGEPRWTMNFQGCRQRHPIYGEPWTWIFKERGRITNKTGFPHLKLKRSELLCWNMEWNDFQFHASHFT